MGLGPAVCQHCQVLADYSETPIPVVRNSTTTTAHKWTHWYCRFCGETDPNDYAGFNNWDKYKENEKFWEFMLNKRKTK
jgi:hypothetical protein